MPPGGFDQGDSSYVAPTEDSSAIEIVVDPNSERIQLLEPFPAWDRNDFLEIPVLIKVKGKCTTDHISPAGYWLRYRGHLDKFSDNMFMGAVNAYTDEVGKGVNVLTAEREGPSLRSPGSIRQKASGGWSWATITTARAAAESMPPSRPGF